MGSQGNQIKKTSENMKIYLNFSKIDKIFRK